MKKIHLALLFSLALNILAWPLIGGAQPPIKIGVSVSLTGDAATFGSDIKNALLLAQADLGGPSRYQLIIEDDHCDGRTATNVAQKFINLDKVQYVVGFACNQAFMPAAPLYQRAGIPVISSFATSGDTTGMGDKLFRLFPADQQGIIALHPYIKAKRHKSVALISEENEYPELMRRTFERLHKEQNDSSVLLQESYKSGETSFESLLIKLKAKKAEALILNSNAEGTFISLVRQIHQLNYSPALYTVYWPSSTSVMQALSGKMDDIVFSDLPGTERLLSVLGLAMLTRYKARFGEPSSVPYAVAFGYEGLRLLDEALRSGKPVHEYLRQAKIEKGVVGKYYFDADGASQGIAFELRRINSGKNEAVVQ